MRGQRKFNEMQKRPVRVPRQHFVLAEGLRLRQGYTSKANFLSCANADLARRIIKVTYRDRKNDLRDCERKSSTNAISFY